MGLQVELGVVKGLRLRASRIRALVCGFRVGRLGLGIFLGLML